MEFKEELELLLNHFIITKEDKKEAYYKIKSKIKKIREFTTNKLGCDIIVTSSLIKLEKIPSFIDNTFKIEKFDQQKDYVLYMLVIMFLEDKATDEQFILSSLTQFIDNILATISQKEMIIDFKDYSTRKSLTDVLKYMIDLGAIKQIDGNELKFKETNDGEVLYENTGVSHYIVRQFKEDIFSYQKAEDFLYSMDVDDSLNKKRYFVYRTLLYYPLFHYPDFNAEISNYFINYRNRIASDLSELFDGDLHIYKDVAFLTSEPKTSRVYFPDSRKMLHDIILLVNDYLVNEINKLEIDKFQFEQLLIKVHEENKMYFNKEFREMKEKRFLIEVVEAMEKFGFLKIFDDHYQFSPAIYLISGNYLKETTKEENDTYEQISIEMEF